MSDKERVSMLWPKEMKTAVRAHVGDRGLTDFTLEAVRQLLQDVDEQDVLVEENEKLRTLVQDLADNAVMCGGQSAPERLSAFSEIDLPPWLDTTGWPSQFARLAEPTPEAPPQPMAEPAEEEPEAPLSDEEVSQAAAPLVAHQEVPPIPASPAKTKEDLFARVMAQTGGDASFLEHLKPASEIEPPAKKPEPEPEPAPAPVVNTNNCVACGNELIDGECWTCG